MSNITSEIVWSVVDRPLSDVLSSVDDVHYGCRTGILSRHLALVPGNFIGHYRDWLAFLSIDHVGFGVGQ
jgi:hypothetical protein